MALNSFNYDCNIYSDEDAKNLIKAFEERCLLVKKSFISLFNGEETDILKSSIETLLEDSKGVDAVNIWLNSLEEKYSIFYKEATPILNESDLVALCSIVDDMYVYIENDIIHGHNLRGFTLSDECREDGKKVIDVFCTDYPFNYSFEDYYFAIYPEEE